MAKRKQGNVPTKGRAEGFEDKSASRLAVKNFEDVADSEDEFFINKDKILLEEGPDAKRRKQLRPIEDDFLDPSDEEVLGQPNDDSSSGEDLEEDDSESLQDGSDDAPASDSDPGTEVEDKEADDLAGWGATRGDYYNADKIETEQDALDEEVEARRIQQKRLKALREADFAFDEAAWRGDADSADENDDSEGADGIVTELLPQLQVDADASPAEMIKLLRQRYPEFEPLSRELLELAPLHTQLSAKVSLDKDGEADWGIFSVARVRFRALSAYLGALAMYFALLTSAAERGVPLAAAEIREHEVMEQLMACREVWGRVQDMEEEEEEEQDSDASEHGELDEADEEEAVPVPASQKGSKKSIKPTAAPHEDAATAALARRAARQRSTEARLASLSGLRTTTATPVKHAPAARRAVAGDDDDASSDLGDEPSLLPHEAAAKAARKKSLRFYTSQLAQKSARRAGAGRAAGGDEDLPYRERFRDKMDRLNREAEVRGHKAGAGAVGMELDGADGGSEDGASETNAERRARGDDDDDDDDATGRLVERRALDKKDARRAREAAYVAAKEEGGRAVRVVAPADAVAVGADGRREIGWKIEKNKGLTAKRGKDVRNPRVKKRRKYEDKTKKLASMKPVFKKGGEGKGGYGGELTGIKSGLVRSTKL